MITIKELRECTPQENVNGLAFTVQCLIKTARLAMEHGTPIEETRWAIADVLELTAEFAVLLGEGCELLEREVKAGIRNTGCKFEGQAA